MTNPIFNIIQQVSEMNITPKEKEALSQIITSHLVKYNYQLKDVNNKINDDVKYTNNEEILNGYLAYRNLNGCSERHLYQISNRCKLFFNHVNKYIADVKIDDIRQYINYLMQNKKWAKGTINLCISILKMLFVWCY